MVKWSQTHQDINQHVRRDKSGRDERDVISLLFELHVEHILVQVYIRNNNLSLTGADWSTSMSRTVMGYFAFKNP